MQHLHVRVEAREVRQGWELDAGCMCLAQVVKQQQMDENNRLRATLEEWSHRNARWGG